MSGDSLAFLDPHEACFSHRTRGRTSSYDWKLSDPKLKSDLRDQIQPFLHELFKSQDAAQWGRFDGTIFRFPLRQDGELSEISKTVYTDEKMQNLFRMFENEVHQLLLFLTSVKKVEFWERSEGRSAVKVMSVSVNSPEALEKRARFKKAIEPFAKDRMWMPQPVSTTYKLQTKFEKSGSKATSRSFLVSQYYDGGASPIPNFTQGKTSRYLPWFGIALPQERASRNGSGGQIFCFLPLPPHPESPTGFKFHVNSFFSVSQDRLENICY